MKHRWITKTECRKTHQVCQRCGIRREKTSVKTITEITLTFPYYHYKYESVWSYYVGQVKTAIRPECHPGNLREYKQNNVINVLTENHG